MTGEYVLPEKYLLETAATIKRFEYSLLGSELKKQSDIAEKEHQISDKFFSLIFWSIKDNKNLIKSLIKSSSVRKTKQNKSVLVSNYAVCGKKNQGLLKIKKWANYWGN